MFPTAAEAHAMCPLRPAYVVGKLVSAWMAILRDVDTVAECHAKNSGPDTVQAEAIVRVPGNALALLLGRREEVVSQVGVRESEIVDQRGFQHTGQAQLCLVGEIAGSDPVRLQSVAAGNTAIGIHTGANEGRVFLVDC